MQISDLITIPTYTVILPVSNQKVKFRPFLVKEEKVLLQIKETEENNTALLLENVFNIVNECIYNAFDSKKLSVSDFEFLFLNIRTKSESSNINFRIKCEKCQEDNSLTVNIDDLKTDINQDVINPIKLSDVLYVEMKYPAAEDLIEQINNKNVDVIRLVKSCIKSFIHNDEILPVTPETSDSVMDFLDCLTTSQFSQLKIFIDNLPKNYIPIKFKCNSCGHENEEKLEGLANFFI